MASSAGKRQADDHLFPFRCSTAAGRQAGEQAGITRRQAAWQHEKAGRQ